MQVPGLRAERGVMIAEHSPFHRHFTRSRSVVDRRHMAHRVKWLTSSGLTFRQPSG